MAPSEFAVALFDVCVDSESHSESGSRSRTRSHVERSREQQSHD